MFDSHIHTKNSLDGRQTVSEICDRAVSAGLSGISITDHVDMWFYDAENTQQRISACIAETSAAREKYKNKLQVLQGVELAEYLYSPAKAEIIMRLTDYDIILSSVHSVLYEDFTDSYSRLPFGKDSASDSKIRGFMHEYFSKVKDMAEKTDIDVLAHLTCPLRYINGKYGRGVSLSDFHKDITEILAVIIERHIALEINTSGINTEFNDFMPDRDTVKMYYEMGGRLVTIGSDAHVPQNIGKGFLQAVQMLKETGFTHYNYYKKRQPMYAAFDVRGEI